MRRSIRTVDTPARIGGDEFCVLPPTRTPRRRVLAERLAAAVEAGGDARTTPPVGVSIGVVACPEHGTDAETLLELADRAMYRAKAAARRGGGRAREPEADARRSAEE